MKKTKLKLGIDNSQYLTFEFDGATRDLYLLDYITISYHVQGKKYILYTDDFVIESLRTAAFMLTQALNNELILHESIDQDIGFLWNEYLKDRPGYNFVEVPLEKDSTMWVGQWYDLWWSKQCKTWLYNKNGSIYFEITPGYKWHFVKPKKNEKYISYGKFIKNYKPIAIIKLERVVAQRWLKKITLLLDIAQKNYDRLDAMQKNGIYFIEHRSKKRNVYHWKVFSKGRRIGVFDKVLRKRIGD